MNRAAMMTTACAQHAHKSCRGRVLDLNARRAEDRWGPCECPCPHDRGPGCEEFASLEAAAIAAGVEDPAARAAEQMGDG